MSLAGPQKSSPVNGTLRPDGFTKILLGTVAAGFVAWAGVVYDTGQQALRAVELNSQRIDAALVRLSRHEERPWHNDAGEAIVRISTRLDGIEKTLERMERLAEGERRANDRFDEGVVRAR